MRVTLLAFGILHDHFPATGALQLPQGATVRDLLERCQAIAPAVPLASIAVAVNREYAAAAHPLADGDEVALLPPVSGGLLDAETAPVVYLTEAPIDAAGLTDALQCGEDGAVVTFDGIVRNQTRGRRTLYLFYEAYADMALAQMRQLAADCRSAYPIRDVVLVHRLGRLEIGESSVFIAVASAHRAAAFDACRWLIDALKQTVPIWKKEFFEDGAVWPEGEPFPAELTPHADRPGGGA
jgi:molybdopterin synthase catalytic subunit